MSLLFGLNGCRIDYRRAYTTLEGLVRTNASTSPFERARAISLLGQCLFWRWGVFDEGKEDNGRHTLLARDAWRLPGNRSLPPSLRRLLGERAEKDSAVDSSSSGDGFLEDSDRREAVMVDVAERAEAEVGPGSPPPLSLETMSAESIKKVCQEALQEWSFGPGNEDSDPYSAVRVDVRRWLMRSSCLCSCTLRRKVKQSCSPMLRRVSRRRQSGRTLMRSFCSDCATPVRVMCVGVGSCPQPLRWLWCGGQRHAIVGVVQSGSLASMGRLCDRVFS